MNESKAIREYLTKHPKREASIPEIAEALGLSRNRAAALCCAMRQREVLVSRGAKGSMTFLLGREPVSRARAVAKPDPKSVNRAEADREWALSQDKQTAPSPGQPETIEQFQRRGGRIEKLPGCSYSAAIVRPMRSVS